MDLRASSWRAMPSACLAVCAEHANLRPQRTGSIGHRLTPICTDHVDKRTGLRVLCVSACAPSAIGPDPASRGAAEHAERR